MPRRTLHDDAPGKTGPVPLFNFKVGQVRDTIFGMSVDTSTDAAEYFPPFIFSLDGINTAGGADIVWKNIQWFSVRPNSFSQVCHYFLVSWVDWTPQWVIRAHISVGNYKIFVSSYGIWVSEFTE